MDSNKAGEFKSRGNECFKAGQLARAVDLYSKAEQADSTDPVYPSNLSAALYEVGDYSSCVHAVLRAWKLLNAQLVAKPDLVVKLSNRLAKALSLGVRARTVSEKDIHVNESDIRALRNASETASEGGSPATREDLTRMWREWDATVPDIKACTEQHDISLSNLSRLPLFSKPLDDLKEYYSIGNDPIINLLDGWGSRTEPDVLNINELPQEKLSEVAFLFGGVGDGRHAFGTISGVFDAYTALPQPKKAVFRTHLTMLDIHEVAIARDLCMLILLDDLNRTREPTMRDEIKATLMYMFLAPVMPSNCHRCLRKVMENVRERLSTDTPNLPEWLHLDRDAIPGVLRTLNSWLTTKKSTKKMLATHQHQNAEASQQALELIALQSGNPALQHKIEETRAEQRREMAETLRAMSDDMIMDLPFVPAGASPAQARALLEKHMDSLVDTLKDSYTKGRVTGYEEMWYERTKVFLPPSASRPSHDGFNDAWEQIKRPQSIKKSTFRKIAAHIAEEWEVNITLFDPIYSDEDHYPGGDGYPDLKYDAFEAVSFMADFNNRHDPDALEKPSIGMDTLTYEVAGTFFEGVAQAIEGLRGRITVELICGGLSEELAKMRLGGDINRPPAFPRKYTRMWLSNVPDYTHGPMNMAVFILPNLQDHPQAAAACNCLLNMGVWKDDDQFFYTYTHLLPKDVPRYLGCRIIRPQAVMEILVMDSQPLPRPLAELATRDELTTWLTHVLFNIFIAGRSQPSPNNVRLPHNLVAFFALLMHLHRVGFPAHWLSDFLARVLSGRMLADIAPYAGVWPIPVSDGTRRVCARQVRTDPWLVELENIIATAYYGVPFSIATALPAGFSRDPEDIRVWEAKVYVTLPFAMSAIAAYGRSTPFEPTTRLLFYRPALGVDPAETVQKMKAIFEGRAAPAPGSFFVLTAQECVQYRTRVQFRLSRRRVERMKQEKWCMVVYRNDLAEIATEPVPAAQWVLITEK